MSQPLITKFKEELVRIANDIIKVNPFFETARKLKEAKGDIFCWFHVCSVLTRV